MDCAEVNVGSDSYIALVLLKEALGFTVFLMRTWTHTRTCTRTPTRTLKHTHSLSHTHTHSHTCTTHTMWGNIEQEEWHVWHMTNNNTYTRSHTHTHTHTRFLSHTHDRRATSSRSKNMSPKWHTHTHTQKHKHNTHTIGGNIKPEQRHGRSSASLENERRAHWSTLRCVMLLYVCLDCVIHVYVCLHCTIHLYVCLYCVVHVYVCLMCTWSRSHELHESSTNEWGAHSVLLHCVAHVHFVPMWCGVPDVHVICVWCACCVVWGAWCACRLHLISSHIIYITPTQ